MNPTTMNVVQGDQGYQLNFTLLNNAGVAIDLTSATLLFQAQLFDTEEIKFSGEMSVDNASSGICHYTTGATDFDAVGQYQCAIVITFTSGEVLTFPNILVIADPKLPIA